MFPLLILLLPLLLLLPPTKSVTVDLTYNNPCPQSSPTLKIPFSTTYFTSSCVTPSGSECNRLNEGAEEIERPSWLIPKERKREVEYKVPVGEEEVRLSLVTRYVEPCSPTTSGCISGVTGYYRSLPPPSVSFACGRTEHNVKPEETNDIVIPTGSLSHFNIVTASIVLSSLLGTSLMFHALIK